MALDTKHIPDTPPPITQEELRDHAIMEELLATKPELQEKGLGHAVKKAWSSFKFSKEDWINSIGFGAIFGTAFGVMGLGVGWGIESLIGETTLGITNHIKEICGTFGLALGGKTAIMHPFADMTKDFYFKCKEGLSEAQEHNKALAYLRERVNAIKDYKQNGYMRGMMEDAQHSVPIVSETPAHTYAQQEAPQRSRVVDAILEKKREALSEMSWADRTQAQRAATPSTQQTL